ncbi:hypothetical protein LG329_01395 [Virgibacillus necropolis]|uniref:hypothetical protein n=1 Tax=Virgibacillus necropolis TaxID=163877 RepID=UPI00384D9DB8
MFFTIVFYAALFITVITTILAIKGNHQLYWVAALFTYIFSFIGGFSIGQITVGLTFVFIFLAVGYSFNIIKNNLQLTLFVIVGLMVGLILVLYVDDYWLFFPFTFFS